MFGEGYGCTPVTPALGNRRQEDHEVEVSVGYIARLSFKKPES